MKLFRSIISAIVMASCAGVCLNVHACSVCFGDPQSSLTMGLHMGVLTLLIIVLLVLGGFAAFFLRLRKLSKNNSETSTS